MWQKLKNIIQKDEISHGSRVFDLLLLPVELVHGRTADFVARFQKELGGECAVDAAGHGDDDFFLFCHKIGILSAGRTATARDGKNIHSFLVPTIPKTIIPGYPQKISSE